jgi:hypothetical protein
MTRGHCCNHGNSGYIVGTHWCATIGTEGTAGIHCATITLHCISATMAQGHCSATVAIEVIVGTHGCTTVASDHSAAMT